MEKASNKLNHYDASEVIDTFSIVKIFDCAILKNWLSNNNGSLKPSHQDILEDARLVLLRKWDEWNEEELKMNFISLVILAAQIEEPNRINTYYERRLVGDVANTNISVIVDFMIASPMNSGRPKTPYFFMQEAPSQPSPKGKECQEDTHDPEGQMLAAMILAQELNKNNQPLYGSWIQGKIWYFTVLNGKDYCVSQAFDAADKNDLSQIVFILRHLKILILNGL
jgi:hypothetical protein